MSGGILERIKLFQGDITKLNVDVIVNAANTTLLGGGGVDGAIHRAAGSELLEECSTLGGCSVGEAKATSGYKLPAKNVIHTVGPVYSAADDVPRLLSSCYRKSLELAVDLGAKSIAFPSISTGAYRYPIDKACPIAIKAVMDFLSSNRTIESVTFVLFSESDFAVYKKYLDNLKFV